MLTVALLLLIGIAARRSAFLPEGTAAAMDAVVVRLALPALVLDVVPDVELSADALVPVAVAWATLGVLVGAVVVGSRLLRLDDRTRATLLVVVPLGNTSFLGFPAVAALLGPDHVGHAVLYDQLGTFVALATYASALAVRLGAASDGGAAHPLRRVLTFPPFLALVAAFALRPFGVPEPLADVAAALGATVTPLAMLAIGLRLSVSAAARRPVALGFGLALRMVLAPALVWMTMAIVGIRDPAWATSLLETAMPPMVTAAVLASEAGLDGELAAGLAGVGVLLAMGTLPLWALMVT